MYFLIRVGHFLSTGWVIWIRVADFSRKLIRLFSQRVGGLRDAFRVLFSQYKYHLIQVSDRRWYTTCITHRNAEVTQCELLTWQLLPLYNPMSVARLVSTGYTISIATMAQASSYCPILQTSANCDVCSCICRKKIFEVSDPSIRATNLSQNRASCCLVT